MLAECVPGGTTIALAVLEGLGIAASGLGTPPDPLAVLAAGTGAVGGAGAVGRWQPDGDGAGGGSSLHRTAPAQRQALADSALVATTAWLAEEPGSDLARLLQLIGDRWHIEPQLQAAGLRFHSCRSAALRDYERGYVKEGVGVGGVAALWELAGRNPEELAQICDGHCDRFQRFEGLPIAVDERA